MFKKTNDEKKITWKKNENKCTVQQYKKCDCNLQKEIYFFMTQKKPDIFHDNDNGVRIKKMLILETKENLTILN